MGNVSNEDRRGSARRTLLLNVRCRIASGVSPEVWLTDLATSGCQLILRAGLLQAGQRIMIRPSEIEGLPGIVQWVFGTRAGIAFEHPLHPAMVNHLLRARPRTRPPAADGGFQDRFGRRLPDWPRTPGGNRRSCS